MPPRNSDTDTGSETEVKNFLGSIDLSTTQKSFISPDSKITQLNRMDINCCLSDKNDHGKSFEILKEFALTSSNLAVNTCNQDNLISPNNDISLNVISQDSATGPKYSLISNNDDNSLSQNRFLASLTNIATNNYLTQEDRNFEYENFINESIWLNLNHLDHNVDCENLQNKVFDSDVINFSLTPIDFAMNVNNFTDLGDIITNAELTLSPDNLEGNFAYDDQNSLKQIAKVALANATSHIEMDKDSIISNSKYNLFINKSPDVITSLNDSKDSLSSSSSEIYQSTEMLCSDSVISNNMNNSIEFLESNLPVEIEKCKCKNTCVINKGKRLIINKDRNIKLINDNNNIHKSEIIDKEINAVTIIPMVTANVQRESVCPIVTLTSPSPTQEKQFEELSMQTSRLLPPQNLYVIPSFVGCDSLLDKLKQDLKQRKTRNKAIENELKPLSTECARLKMNKYFIQSKNSISRSQPTWNKETEAPNVEITKLDIKPKLSSKINTKEILKYFDNSSFSNKRNKYKTYNIITKGAVEQNDCRKSEIDIESITDMNEKDVDAINKEFNQIEKHSRISYLMENNRMGFSYNLSLEAYSGEEEVEHTFTCDNSGLVYNDLIELDLELNDDADSRMLNYNILKSNNKKLNNKNVQNSNTKLRSNILKLHTDITCNILTPDQLIDQKNNIQINVTNKGKNMKEIDHTEEILECDIKNTNKEKGINVKSSNNMLENDVTKEDVTKVNLQNNISEREVLLYKRNKQIIKINSMNGNIDKNKKFFRNLSLEDNIHFNAELTTSLLLKNNTDNANKGNILYKNDTNLSKSDMNLNKNIPWVDFKNISNNNSKSLFELRNIMREIVPTAEVADIKEILDVSNNIKHVKIINNNSTQHCINKILKEVEQKHMFPDIDVPERNSLGTYKSTTSSYKESALPVIPIRKTIKKSVELSNQDQNVESTSKLQNPIVQDVTKLYGPTNNVFNIRNQDIEKCPKIKSHNLNVETLKNQNINNVSENQRQDVPESQNHDTKSTLKQPSQNITKLQNQHVTQNENFDNEIIRDGKIIIETQNCNVINVPKAQCQNESVQSIKKSYLSNWRLPDRLEKSIKFSSKNNESKKDKCVIS